MNIMQSVLGQMQEERLDRPEDEREDGQPSWPEGSRNSDSSQGLNGSSSGDDPAEESQEEPESGQPALLSDAMREASRRREDRPRNQNAPGGLHSFIDKRKTRLSVAAGPNEKVTEEPSDETLFFQYQQGDDESFFFI